MANRSIFFDETGNEMMLYMNEKLNLFLNIRSTGYPDPDPGKSIELERDDIEALISGLINELEIIDICLSDKEEKNDISE